LIFGWKLSEWIRDRFERTIGDLTSLMKPYVKTENFINIPGRFFHYEPLFTSFFSKKIIYTCYGNVSTR
jgi:hypothetical protein